jgi:hypothetical protein
MDSADCGMARVTKYCIFIQYHSSIYPSIEAMDDRARKPPTHPMPEVAAFVQSLREAFGDTVIDEAIKQGKSGEPAFYACENGRSVGTASPSGISWRVDDSLRDRRYCAGCDGSCVGQGVSCSVWCRQLKLET